MLGYFAPNIAPSFADEEKRQQKPQVSKGAIRQLDVRLASAKHGVECYGFEQRRYRRSPKLRVKRRGKFNAEQTRAQQQGLGGASAAPSSLSGAIKAFNISARNCLEQSGDVREPFQAGPRVLAPVHTQINE